MALAIRPLTPDLWPAFEDLFGTGGASNGCWCMYWRIGSEYHERERAKNRSALRRIVKQGPPPGFTSNVFTGTIATFRRAGFKAVARRKATRPIMRHDLKD